MNDSAMGPQQKKRLYIEHARFGKVKATLDILSKCLDCVNE